MVYPDEIFAYHEAGHAVLARRLGIPFSGIKMDLPPNGKERAKVDGVEAATERDRNSDLPTQLLAAEIDCKFLLAGPHAEMMFYPDENKVTALKYAMDDVLGSDMENAKRLVRSRVLLARGTIASISECGNATPDDVAMCQSVYERLSAETEALVAENWSAIVRVAESAQIERTLSMAEVDELIAG